ncbi:unnamed protein product [Clavelina lepadiformis]|uniref:Mitochondrial assembly of ribosomal large subunit protein 1 n=1 Tax=Clavelina lepadiformis TaxID=159417 RepID=A0ABP0FGA8_CLALP
MRRSFHLIRSLLPHRRLCSGTSLNLCRKSTSGVTCYPGIHKRNFDFFFRTVSTAHPKLMSEIDEKTEAHSDKQLNNSRFKEGILSLDEIHRHIVDENGRDIVVIELAETVNYVKYFVLVTANSTRHLMHMAESLNRFYKQMKQPSDPFTLIEGKGSCNDWQCIDFGNSVVHFMLEDVREKYQLEKLWLLGPKFDDLTKNTPTMEEIYEQVSKQGLTLFSDQKDDSAEFIDDFDMSNLWESSLPDEEAAKSENPPAKDLEDDEDAYII